MNSVKNSENAKKRIIFFSKGVFKAAYQQPMTWNKISKVVKFAIHFTG